MAEKDLLLNSREDIDIDQVFTLNDEKPNLLSKRGLGVIPFLLFEELDVVFRFTIFIAVYTGIYLFNYSWASQELPLVYVGLNIVTSLSRISFVGGFTSYSLSFMLGSVVAILLVGIITFICGSNITTFEYDAPTTELECVYNITSGSYTPQIETIQMQGDTGDPNVVLFSTLIFLCTFLLLFAGRTNAWTKGAVINLNILSAVWFLGMKTEGIPIPTITTYFIILRTIGITMVVYLGCLLLPLPKLFPSFVPQPRFSTSTVIVMTKALQNDLAEVVQIITDEYRQLITSSQGINPHHSNNNNSNDDDMSNIRNRKDAEMSTSSKYSDFSLHFSDLHHVPNSTQLYLKEKIATMMTTILKIKFLMKESAQWETFWWTLPFPHCISTRDFVAYISRAHIAVHHCRMIVNSFQYLKVSDDSPFQSLLTSASPIEIDQLLDRSAAAVKRSLKSQLFVRCDQLGGCGKSSTIHNDGEDEDLQDVISAFEGTLWLRGEVPLQLFSQVSESMRFEFPLSPQQPLSVVNFYLVWNYFSMLGVVNELEHISNDPPGPNNNNNDRSSYNERQKEDEKKQRNASLKLLGSVWIRQVIEFIARVLRWVWLSVIDWSTLLLGFWNIVINKKGTYQYKQVSRNTYLIEKTKHLFSCLVISLSIMIGLMFLFVDYLRINTPSSLIVVVTIATSVEPENPGTAINRSINRLSGTAIGISMSYLLLAISRNDKIAVYIGSIFFALIGRFLMGREKFSEMATAFVTTCWIVMYSGTLDLPANILLANLAEKGTSVGIGIVVAFIVLFLWPIHPHIQLKYNIVKYLLLDISYSLKQIFSKPLTKSYVKESLSRDITLEQANVRTMDIRLQNDLLIEAREEIHFLFAYSFPFGRFSSFIELEKELTTDIISLGYISHSLEKTLFESKFFYSNDHISARFHFYRTIKIAFQEISDKITNHYIAPFDVSLQLKKAYQQYLSSLNSEFSHVLTLEKINIVRLYSLMFLFANLVDSISRLDSLADDISAYDKANKPKGFKCFDR